MRSYAVFILLAACNGTPNEPVVGDSLVPNASFTSADTAVVGVPVVFDASATTAADTYAWDFGDGTRGSSSKLAHVFTAAGTYTVTLRARNLLNAEGSAFKTVTVSANPLLTPSRMLPLQVYVKNRAGTPIDGATVSAGGDPVLTSGGTAQVPVGADVPVSVRVTKQGYVAQTRRVFVPGGLSSGEVSVTLLDAEAAQTIDATLGGEVIGKDGARLRLPAGSLVDADGNSVSGDVSLTMTPVAVTREPRTFPGKFEGVSFAGDSNLLFSWGTVDLTFSQNGKVLNLVPGAQAYVDVPMYSPRRIDGAPVAEGDIIPAWTLDERTGLWMQEGEGVVMRSDTSPTGFVLRVLATHFSWFNCDMFGNGEHFKNTKCMIDSNYDGVYEDLTGTGYCSNAGTNSNGARDTNDPPVFYVETIVPAGGTVLPIPANVAMQFIATANNGLYSGRADIAPGAVGETSDVILYLDPVDGPPSPSGVTGFTGPTGTTAPCTDLVDEVGALPTAATGSAINPAYSTDRYTLDAVAGTVYTMTLTRPGSNLQGVVTVHKPGCGAVLATQPFINSNERFMVYASESGPLQVDVRGTSPDPAGYTIGSSSLPAIYVDLSTPYYHTGTDFAFVFDTGPGDNSVLINVGNLTGGTLAGEIYMNEGSPTLFGAGSFNNNNTLRTLSPRLNIVRVAPTAGTGPVTVGFALAQPLTIGSLYNETLQPLEARAWAFTPQAPGEWLSTGSISETNVTLSGTINKAIMDYDNAGIQTVVGMRRGNQAGTRTAYFRVARADISEVIDLNTVKSLSVEQMADYYALRLPTNTGELVKFYARSPGAYAFRVYRNSPNSAPFGPYGATEYDNLLVAAGTVQMGSVVWGGGEQVVRVGHDTNVLSASTGPFDLYAYTGQAASMVTPDSALTTNIAPVAAFSNQPGFTYHPATLPSGTWVVTAGYPAPNGLQCEIHRVSTTTPLTCTITPQRVSDASRVMVNKNLLTGPTNYTLYTTSIEDPTDLGSGTTASGTIDPFEIDAYRFTNGPVGGTATVAVTPVGFAPRVCLTPTAAPMTNPNCTVQAQNQLSFAVAPSGIYQVRVYQYPYGPTGGSYDLNITRP